MLNYEMLPLFWPVIACNILNDLDGIEPPVYLCGSEPTGLSDGGTYILDSIGSTKNLSIRLYTIMSTRTTRPIKIRFYLIRNCLSVPIVCSCYPSELQHLKINVKFKKSNKKCILKRSSKHRNILLY